MSQSMRRRLERIDAKAARMRQHFEEITRETTRLREREMDAEKLIRDFVKGPNDAAKRGDLIARANEFLREGRK